MIPATTLAAINDVREAFLGVLSELPQVPSFKTLCQTSPEVQERFGKLARVAARPHVTSAATGQITCAILGSSGHGKTTVLDEMFPSLSARGWLETDVTDTTSQALRLEHAPPGNPSADTVTVRSWQIGQLKRLLAHDAVVEQNERDGIEVTWLDDRVVPGGADATELAPPTTSRQPDPHDYALAT
jgi:hypothetical protein